MLRRICEDYYILLLEVLDLDVCGTAGGGDTKNLYVRIGTGAITFITFVTAVLCGVAGGGDT